MELDHKLDKFSNLLNIDVTELKNKWLRSIAYNNDIILKKKQVFLEYSITDSSENQPSVSLAEQLEIAVQILINEGYTFLVYCAEEKQYEDCKKFVEVFKNQAISYLEQNAEKNWECEHFCESELAIVMSKKCLLEALIIEKPFVALQIDDMIINKISINKNYFISAKEFNTGVFVKKIKYLSAHYELSKKEMSKMFDAQDDVFVKEFEKISVTEAEDTNSVKEALLDQSESEVKDFDSYRVEIKKNIQTLIEQGFLNEAKGVVSEYEKMVNNDIEIYSIKGVISIMEGNFAEAECVLKQGLVIDANHFDLNYNMGYISNLKDKKEDAFYYFKKALHNTKNKTDYVEVSDILELLNPSLNKKMHD